MNTNDTPLEFFVKLITGDKLDELVQAYGGNRYCKQLTAQRMIVTLVIAQLEEMGSLREVEGFTEVNAERLKAAGLGGRVARSTLAEGMERINAGIARGLFEALRDTFMKRLPKTDRKRLDLSIVDSTTIHIACYRSNWGHYNHAKGAIKMHTMLRHSGDVELPEQMVLTDQTVADITVAEERFRYSPDSILVADRGYESKRLFRSLSNLRCPFVVRVKQKTHYYPLSDMPLQLRGNALQDEVVARTANECAMPSAPRFRRCVLPPFEGHKNPIVILTNDFGRTASELGEIYRTRWHIELFFKWIKQHLHVTAFLSNSPNAILNQLYAALILALLLAYLRTLTPKSSPASPLYIFRKLRDTLFLPIKAEYLLLGFLSIERPPPPLKHPTIQLTLALPFPGQ